MDDQTNEALALTTEIVAAYVSNHSIAPNDLPNLIGGVFKALSTLGQAEAPAPAERPEPAVPIRKSIGDTFLVCLEDGKKLKMLKRYLQTRYNLTPAAYRQRWGLPSDYPMVAPAYAEQRSNLARQNGLGRKPAAQTEVLQAPEPTPEPEAAAEPAAKRRVAGRKKAA